MVSTVIEKRKREESWRRRRKRSKLDHYERKIQRAKRKARSELDLFDWGKWNFCRNDYWISSYADVLPRIDYRKTSKREFIALFEAKNKPVVITHATDDWQASKYWDEEYLIDTYGSHLFKIGEDDDSNNIYMKMKHFLYYAKHDGRRDDSPLYIFDSGFYKDRRRSSKKRNRSSRERSDSDDKNGHGHSEPRNDDRLPRRLLDDYTVPDYFSDDLFRLTGDQRRPPYRWLVIGGARSGTGIHTDPLGTSAWNALIKGHKRWVMFPPGTPKEIVDPPMKPYDHEGVTWFSKVYPKFSAYDDPNDSRTLGERLGMIEALQRPGETIFVPGGWIHVVMNLDLTIAVTQNFCSPTNIEYVYLSTRDSRPKLGAKLYQKIQKLASRGSETFSAIAAKLETLRYVPQLPPSSSDSSDSSSTSFSSSSSSAMSDMGTRRRSVVSSTDSETDWSDGTCMCKKCKQQRKNARRSQALSK